MIEIELKKKSPEEMENQVIVLTIENSALRGCLEAIEKEITEIYDFAVNNDFVGDLLIAGTANNIRKQIEYVLTGKD